MDLENDILKSSKSLGIDPYNEPFTPKMLGINANNYGSFSDFCGSNDTKSGQYNKKVILKVAKRNKAGKPRSYLLIKN